MGGPTGSGVSGWRWDVALSFASAQRGYVERVAARLKSLGVRCFYDADEQTDLWGRYLSEELPDIYAEQAGAVVVFVSDEYAARDWTQLERRAALNRAVRERRGYVLPARFDDTPLPGLLSDLVAIDLRTRSAEDFATLVVDKLTRLGILTPTLPTAPTASSAVGGMSAVWNVPGRLATFTGRTSLLEEIAAGLAGSGRGRGRRGRGRPWHGWRRQDPVGDRIRPPRDETAFALDYRTDPSDPRVVGSDLWSDPGKYSWRIVTPTLSEFVRSLSLA